MLSKPNMLTLDLQLFAQEKTERATPQKRREARQKGQVAKSMELPGAFIILFTFLFLNMFGGFFKDRIFRLFSHTLHNELTLELTQENVIVYFSRLVIEGMLLLLPILLIVVICAVLANYIQIGFILSGEPLMMKLSKLNPVEGAKRIFSIRSIVEFLKSVIKLLLVGTVVYLTIVGEKKNLLSLPSLPLLDVMQYASQVTLSLGVKIAVVWVVLAILDYMYQRYEYEKNLRMSKQDIKEEYKKTEGDPLIKGKIRERQRKMAMQRMMQEVPKADVVITNPTHFAVALRYDTANMDAPTVIAKGQDYVALKIKEIAQSNGIITMENKPLARALYEQTDIGEAIPADLFQAVAEVLAYVYRVKGALS